MLYARNENVYFYGEFGCLNYSVLGHIEERQPSFKISTQPDYFKLMHMKCSKISSANDAYQSDYKGSGFGHYVRGPLLKGLVSVHEYWGLKRKRCLQNIKPIKTPLVHDIGLEGQYVSISFRNRQHETDRNLADNAWGDVIRTIKEATDLPLVAHGMSLDTKGFDGIYQTQTIEESMAYMNKSVVFVASMSGIAQFASNCACGVIQIGDTSRHIEYDPFDKGAVAVDIKDFKNALLDFVK